MDELNHNLTPIKTEKDIIIKLEENIQLPKELIAKYYIRNGGCQLLTNSYVLLVNY